MKVQNFQKISVIEERKDNAESGSIQWVPLIKTSHDVSTKTDNIRILER